MKMHRLIIVVGVTLLVMHLSVFAGSSGIKERMKKRLPVLTALKAKGVVGENNKGYLEFKGANREEEEIVTAENKDRAVVYAAIARKTKTTTEIVGARRAKKIAQAAPKGHWLQDEAGKWYQK